MGPFSEIAVRAMIVARAKMNLGKPYFIGADGPVEFDCNGLIFDAYHFNGAADVYPWNDRHAAHAFWDLLPRVAWADRQPGDVVCYGDGLGCHHVVLVIDETHLIGANHGGPKHDGETDDAYRTRMKQADGGRGARVCVVPSEYWSSHRLGVVRIPAFAMPEGT